MFLSRPSLGDVSDRAGMAISNASIAPGLRTSSANLEPAALADSFARTIRMAVVDAVYVWIFEVPAIETRPVDRASDAGVASCCALPTVAAAAQNPTVRAHAKRVKA